MSFKKNTVFLVGTSNEWHRQFSSVGGWQSSKNEVLETAY